MFYYQRKRKGKSKFTIRLFPGCDSIVFDGNPMEKLLQWVRFMEKYLPAEDGLPGWASNEVLVYDRKKKSRGKSKNKMKGDFYVELYSFDCSHMYRIYTKDVERLLNYKKLHLKPCRKASKKDSAPFEGGE